MGANAISGTFVRLKTLVDGTVRIELDLDCDLNSASQLGLSPGSTLAIARLTDKAAQSASLSSLEGENVSAYGREAQALRLSSFFRTYDVWVAVGTDAEFLEWLKTQPCCVTHSAIKHGGDVVPAHVRRVANGAGVGIKPPYSAVPMCDTHHRKQHDKGETAVMPREEWDRQRVLHLSRWCWEKLKSELGYEHWNEVPPHVLHDWATKHGVERFLPGAYQVAAERVQ